MLRFLKCAVFIVFVLPCIGYTKSEFNHPMTTCLNDYVIPKLTTDIPPKKLVDDAFIACKPQVDEWLEPFEPINKREENYKTMYDFYIRMINIRWKTESANH
ncbi:conserved hypothetical protein [Xenorhabdus bovienii str. oregonense]|uniref:Uncharacterized protein n=1 Tax=Xenorhabdus bovienii str. oregonense TaxID=1398202 RepID=A0A077P6H8_XENBV|nr:hypothetical protein [Xenorhabdus bovienii]CDH05401.1 conserved hypothetical protein [Xenorhabdus bovienii str. oregonense]